MEVLTRISMFNEMQSKNTTSKKKNSRIEPKKITKLNNISDEVVNAKEEL